MSAQSLANRERRVRRFAYRLDCKLMKLRGDRRYWLIDIETGGVIMGERIARGALVGYDLDEVEQWLTG